MVLRDHFTATVEALNTYNVSSTTALGSKIAAEPTPFLPLVKWCLSGNVRPYITHTQGRYIQM